MAGEAAHSELFDFLLEREALQSILEREGLQGTKTLIIDISMKFVKYYCFPSWGHKSHEMIPCTPRSKL